MFSTALVTKEHVNRLIQHCRVEVPNFRVFEDKRNSYLMNWIDGIVFPFNKKFLDGYITTIGGRVYFPKGAIERSPMGSLEVIAHEFVHAWDAKRLTLPLFGAWYLSFLSFCVVGLLAFAAIISWAGLLPFAALTIHSLAVLASKNLRKITGFPILALSVILSAVLSVWLEGLQASWILVPLVFALPLPAPGRFWAEMRGYGMSVFMEVCLYGRADIDGKVDNFTGPDYYFMWPFKEWVVEGLRKWENDSRFKRVEDPAFMHIFEFLSREGLLLEQQRRSS